MKRREAREQAFLLLFEKTFKNETLEEILVSAELSRDFAIDAFAKRVFEGINKEQITIDEMIEHHIVGWKKERLSRVALSILRLAVFEMLIEKNIPGSVSINEAVEIAKCYGTQDDASFINGVLSGVYKELEQIDG